MTLFLVALAFLTNSAAHILLKIGATAGLHLGSRNVYYLVKENYIVFLGLVFFGLSFVSYFVVLKTLPVSVAYPTIIIASFVIINFFAHYYLKENLNPAQLLGYAFLLVGLGLIYYFRP